MLNRAGLRLCSLLLASVLAAAPALAGTYTTVYPFTGGSDGATPSAALIQGTYDSNYGVTANGGDLCALNPATGCGTVYVQARNGKHKTLFTFTGVKTGANPEAPLLDRGGTLYGTTWGGGQHGYGVVFRVTIDGSEFREIYGFNQAAGYDPTAALVPGPSGAVYGVTRYGGPTALGRNAGVLFELFPDSVYRHLHDFTGGADGAQPNALLINAKGTLFGSTNAPQGCSDQRDCGLVFEYVPTTGVFTVLHRFTGSEGKTPIISAIGADGSLYGAAKYGGGGDKGGSLFELRPVSGGLYHLTTLYVFDNAPGGPGTEPSGGPVFNAFGDLIGTTLINGALYKFGHGKMQTLYIFPAQVNPVPPIIDHDHTIIGAGAQGGITPCSFPDSSIAAGCGFIYSYAP